MPLFCFFAVKYTTYHLNCQTEMVVFMVNKTLKPKR